MNTAWIGLTGGVGSGKSQAAACFSALGVPVIDADKINRELIDTPGGTALQHIRQQFGSQAIDSVSGCLKRAYIRQLIFSNVQAKQRLEAILHPLIIQTIRERQQKHSDCAYGIVEIPILAEQPLFQSLVDRILLIHCEENIRLKRVMQRNNLSEREVRAIMDAQASDEQRLTMADDIIHNAGSLADLEQAVVRQHRLYQAQYG